MSHVTMQQIQQVLKQGGGAVKAVGAVGGIAGGTATKLVPMSLAQQPIKQTIQVSRGVGEIIKKISGK